MKEPRVPITFTLGPLYVEAGGLWHRIHGRWWPDALHVWWGKRSLSLYWKRSPHDPRRVVLERL